MERLRISQIQEGLRTQKFSCTELTQSFIDRIRKRDGTLGAYLHVMEEDALATAKRVDAARSRGDELSVLAGVPLAVKDTILVAGHPCTASSKILESYVATYDATAVAKLKANDAVLLGKTNCDEFAMGSSTENAALGNTVNPWDASRVPGGSSGGSAAAVAADLCVAALGSDTGGSVRQPASLCGVVGLKPTYGHVSRYGLMAMASSFDVLGPLARCVADARTLFRAIRGRDPLDATSSESVVSSVQQRVGTKKIRVGIPTEYFGAGIDRDVEHVVRDAIGKLEELGCDLEEVSLPHTMYGLAVYYVLMPSEVSANLERYDGIRYGHSAARERAKAPLLEVYTRSRAEGFGAEPKRRIMLGTYALSAGYADQFYKRGLAVRQRIKEDFRSAFERVDILVTPTAPTPAWPIGEKALDPLQMYLSDIFTVSANVAGIPALSVPCGFVDRNGVRLPVGLQLMGKWFNEEPLLTLAEQYEQATSWHAAHPL